MNVNGERNVDPRRRGVVTLHSGDWGGRAAFVRVGTDTCP